MIPCVTTDQHLHDTLDLAHRGKLLGTTFIRTC
jgi:hypothetical protein